MSRRFLLLFGICILVIGGSYSFASGFGDPVDVSPDSEPSCDRLIEPGEDGHYLWPYTSRERSADERVLAINLIVLGPDERVRHILDEQAFDWEATDPEDQVADTYTYGSLIGNSAQWDDAHGATRYTYFETEPCGENGAWVDESYQLHTGTYLGSRYHVRAYTAETTDWTALQAHREYWDWFRLRHTVTDVQDSRDEIESEFTDQPDVQEVSREYHGTTRGWTDGWLSVIEVAAITPVVFGSAIGLVTVFSENATQALRRGGRRLLAWCSANIRGGILALGVAGLFLSVRTVGLVLETTVPWISLPLLIEVLYPLIAAGLPAVTIVFSLPPGVLSQFSRNQRDWSWFEPSLTSAQAFVFTAIGLFVAFVVDFVGLGILSLPIQLLVYRLGLIVSLGLLAAGSARGGLTGISLTIVGLLGWGIGLVLPRFGYI